MLLIIRGNVYKKVYNGTVMNNLMNKMIFTMVQMGTSQSLAEVHKLACERVFTKMNEDRSLYELRGSWKKVKGDLENDVP